MRNTRQLRIPAGSLVLGLYRQWPDADECMERAKRIVSALLASEDHDTAAGVLRELGVPESQIWETVEAVAGEQGEDPAEVFEVLYSALEEG